MGTEPIESLMNNILKRYNRKPEGWNVLIDGRGNVLIIGPKVGYRLKLITLNPQEYTGVGTKIEGLEEMRRILKGIPSYGFRPLSTKETKELFNTVHNRDAVQNKLIKELLGMKPVPTWELQEKRTKAFLSGPIITHPNLSAISERQRELEARLSIEADKLFRKKFPRRAGIYS